ncbi:hypothetical protein PVAR5_6217 [Paecilomyces variotii No. 5]|uniref:Uncharacterized protein n=1 Tax=Byssochlamys spectabilis (strain No. 5 / NBRC 109023) TaxID=1356009 RepID=V5FIE8_BYSSN|nr:hypothetical protein PVAR5_6217 [Paecilomyces variotii No. 5]
MGDIKRIYKKYGGKELAVKAPRDARLDTKGLTPEPVEGRMTGVPRGERKKVSGEGEGSGRVALLACIGCRGARGEATLMLIGRTSEASEPWMAPSRPTLRRLKFEPDKAVAGTGRPCWSGCCVVRFQGRFRTGTPPGMILALVDGFAMTRACRRSLCAAVVTVPGSLAGNSTLAVSTGDIRPGQAINFYSANGPCVSHLCPRPGGEDPKSGEAMASVIWGRTGVRNKQGSSYIQIDAGRRWPDVLLPGRPVDAWSPPGSAPDAAGITRITIGVSILQLLASNSPSELRSHGSTPRPSCQVSTPVPPAADSPTTALIAHLFHCRWAPECETMTAFLVVLVTPLRPRESPASLPGSIVFYPSLAAVTGNRPGTRTKERTVSHPISGLAHPIDIR